MSWTCPHCGLHIPGDVVLPVHCICQQSASSMSEGEIQDAQREHWLKLHRFPYSADWECESRCQWWREWQESIPNIGCSCRKHWRKLVAKMPPDFSSREAFFNWTIAAHNSVNERLGKPIVSAEDARRLHGVPQEK